MGEARNSARSATSALVPKRRSGSDFCATARSSALGARRAMPSVSSMGPGMIEFTRMPSPPHSMASTRVSMSTPALAAHTRACSGWACTDCGAEMLMITAPGFFRYWCAERTTLKVPKRSMSTTALNALGDIPSTAAGKLPAAPEIRMSMSPSSLWTAASTPATAAASRASAAPAALPPWAFNCFTAASTRSLLRLITASLAPRSANASAMARLMPLVPPATKPARAAKANGPMGSSRLFCGDLARGHVERERGSVGDIQALDVAGERQACIEIASFAGELAQALALAADDQRERRAQRRRVEVGFRVTVEADREESALLQRGDAARQILDEHERHELEA